MLSVRKAMKISQLHRLAQTRKNKNSSRIKNEWSNTRNNNNYAE